MTKYFVYCDSILVCRQDGWHPWSYQILANLANPQTNGVTKITSTRYLRSARLEDFDKFRMAVPPNFNPEN